MAYSEQEVLTFNQVKDELLSLCANNRTGDLSLFTAEKHAAVISLFEGEIVGLRYRISRGSDALRLIKGIRSAKIRFQKSDSSASRVADNDIPPTSEILKMLGIEQEGSAVQSKARRVLVVEDSTTQRKIICKMLAQEGYRLTEAKDGYEALSIAKYEKPDLILLDIIMPGIDGYEVMSLMKGLPGMRNVPIIMLTSRDTLIDKMRGKVSGTNEYLTKPFKREELMKKISKYLTGHDDALSVNV